MTTSVYQTWLADRGIDSPGSQPFKSLAADLSPDSHLLILATAGESDLASVEAVTRLASALRKTSGKISWLVVDGAFEVPSIRILRAALPTLTNLVRLTDGVPVPPETTYATEEQNVASRPLRILHGPTMAVMASDGDTKKRFWLQLQAWMTLPN